MARQKEPSYIEVLPEITCPESSSFAYGLCRLSPEEEKDRKNTSIANQKELIIKWCKANDVRLTKFWVELDTHSWEFARPILNEMLRQAPVEKIRIILVKDYSRLARKLLLQEGIIEDLQDKGIRVVSVMEQGMEEEDLSRTVTAKMNETLIKKLRKDSWNGVLFRLEKGLPARRPPFGYWVDKDMNSKTFKQWFIDKVATKKVRRVFESIMLGQSWKEVCKEIHISQDVYFGIKSNEEHYQGWLIYPRTILDFKGAFMRKEVVRYKGIHEPIICRPDCSFKHEHFRLESKEAVPAYK